MAEQIRENNRRERGSMSFNVRAIACDPATDKVFVTGVQTISGSDGKPVARTRTYELILGFAHYRPVIRHLDVYPEEPCVGCQVSSSSGCGRISSTSPSRPARMSPARYLAPALPLRDLRSAAFWTACGSSTLALAGGARARRSPCPVPPRGRPPTASG